jgi:hypothetical protein
MLSVLLSLFQLCDLHTLSLPEPLCPVNPTASALLIIPHKCHYFKKNFPSPQICKIFY